MKKMYVTAAVIVKADYVLLAQRGDSEAHLNGKWEFPGGKIERGETPEACLKREIFEELGVVIDVGGPVCESTLDLGEKQLVLMAYWATVKNGNMSPVDHERIEWVKPYHLLSYDLLPADIPIAEKVMEYLTRSSSFC